MYARIQFVAQVAHRRPPMRPAAMKNGVDIRTEATAQGRTSSPNLPRTHGPINKRYRANQTTKATVVWRLAPIGNAACRSAHQLARSIAAAQPTDTPTRAKPSEKATSMRTSHAADTTPTITRYPL